jgi:hypothetical protein
MCIVQGETKCGRGAHALLGSGMHQRMADAMARASSAPERIMATSCRACIVVIDQRAITAFATGAAGCASTRSETLLASIFVVRASS